MQMAQVPQRRPILFTHALSKPRIIQPLIPRRLRHVLQHAQPVTDRLLSVRRHLTPLRQHIILHVIALLRRHPTPHLRSIAQHLLLRRRHALQTLLVLQSALTVRRRHIPPTVLGILLQRTRPIRICLNIRPRNRLRSAIPSIWRPVIMRILPRRRLPAARSRSGGPMLRRQHGRRQRQHQCRRERKRPAQAQPAPPLTEFAHPTHRKNLAYPSTANLTSLCLFPAAVAAVVDSTRRSPVPANRSTHRSSTIHRNSPAPANRFRPVPAHWQFLAPPFRLDANQTKPSPATTSTPQTPLAVTAQTPTTSSASPARQQRVHALARRTHSKVRSAAAHPASPTTRGTHSHAVDKPRTSSSALPFPSSLRPSTAHPHRAGSGFPSDCNS